MRGESLPVEGGFDSEGHLTRNPEAIEVSRRPLPIGYWKGSGLALMLDLIAGMLSGGSTTHQIAPEPVKETRLSQVFLAVDPAFAAGGASPAQIADQVIMELQRQAHAAGEDLRYPGQRVMQVRQESLEKGVPVEPAIWRQVQEMLSP